MKVPAFFLYFYFRNKISKITFSVALVASCWGVFTCFLTKILQPFVECSFFYKITFVIKKSIFGIFYATESTGIWKNSHLYFNGNLYGKLLHHFSSNSLWGILSLVFVEYREILNYILIEILLFFFPGEFLLLPGC